MRFNRLTHPIASRVERILSSTPSLHLRRGGGGVASMRRPLLVLSAFLFALGLLLTGAPATEADHVSLAQNLTATVVSTTQIDLSWQAPTQTGNGSIRYLITNVTTNTQLLDFLDNHVALTYSVTGLQPGTTYTFRVGACDSDVHCISASSLLPTVTATTLAPPAKPACRRSRPGRNRVFGLELRPQLGTRRRDPVGVQKNYDCELDRRVPQELYAY